MVFNSLEFLIFFPIVLLIYYVIPEKIKYIWLLAASYYFYMCWNAKYALLLLLSTAVTYVSGILLEKVKYRKCVVAGSFAINLAILVYFKYSNFALSLFTAAFAKLNIQINVPQVDVLLPVGISFYTFQALSYTMDVYRKEIYAEKNFLRYALFVSFFPQLVAGPIERSKNLLKQLAVVKKFDFDLAREGLLLMLWGYFLKVVIADRVAIFVDCVYNSPETYGGWYLIVGTLLFAVQVYCDFAGYSTIAMGASLFLGIRLMENFNAPYISFSVTEFWRKWHISLMSWFKDYLYIPLGGNRKGTVRKFINKMIVCLVSGLWHGAALKYIAWGGINGLYQIIEELTAPVRKRIVSVLRLNTQSFGHKLFSFVLTFSLIDFSHIFFRANSLKSAFYIIKSIFTASNPWIFYDESIYMCGLDADNFRIMIISILILTFADICKHMGIKLREVILRQDYWFRWLFIAASVAAILTYGIWGPGYSAANFIYFQF